ncbi:Lipopolysaccharide export system permease protein LptG [Candidatus Magnetaquicoccaceae bacterium FCR-1]|uniref:Lipopolysaccharide export system permease protein LptG n=1 Tax=Candidatus Magnetaquiglobus chichijimensis TaxID=3141448 RepID=A0ABQ0CDK6_9PROT
MPILFRHLLSFFLTGFLKTLGVFVGLFLLIDGIEGIRRYTPKPNFNTLDLALLILSRLPNYLGMLTPSMLLLATLMGVARLTRDNEITVMRASGVSLVGILAPLLTGGLIVALFHGLLIAQIVPRTNALAQKIEDHIVDRLIAPPSKSGDLWLRDGGRIIHIQKFDPDRTTLHGVTAFTFDAEHRLAARLEASRATFDGQGWKLHEGLDYRFLPTVEVQAFEARPWQVSLDPQRLAASTPPPNMLTVIELIPVIDRLEQDGHDATRHRMILHRRLAAPAINLAAIALAFPFALRLPRSGGALRSSLLGTLLGFLMFVLVDLATAFGLGGRLPPILAAWAPVLFFAGVSGFLFLHLAYPRHSR